MNRECVEDRSGPKLMILGGDGYLGRMFISLQTAFTDMTIVSRSPIFPERRGIVLPDLHSIPDGFFRGIDVVVNCLGVAHRNDIINRKLFYSINRDLTLFLARAAQTQGVRKFVQMSSIAVYGLCDHISIASPLNPITHYGKSKAEADRGLLSLEDSRFSVLIVRPPMIYGKDAPGNYDKLLRVVKALPVLPFLDATGTHDLLHVNTFVTLIEKAVARDASGVILIKDDHPLSMKELVDFILSSLNMTKPFIPCPFKKVIKLLAPGIYHKLFLQLHIESNFP